MKVYFAGSIRGGRVDADLYYNMIDHIKKTDVVLTEHVGNVTLQETDDDVEIYEQDIAWLKEADVLIAECSCPSLGVGYEIAYAQAINKPIYIFYNPSKCSLSAMLMGNTYLTVYPYETEEEIYPLLDEILSK